MDGLSIAPEIRRRVRPPLPPVSSHPGALTVMKPQPPAAEPDENDAQGGPEPAEPHVLPLGGRGRLLSPREVAAVIYGGKRTPWWITHNFAPEYKIRQGRRTYWWEADALAWLDSLRALERKAG